ncbi:MAG TPA: efflux RND transporter periplasmic adaptor subunit [Gemmataceae bacterium]|nr:efflux RND transporter periplasmic adaptor subunit [Gemmataceae bacterium]
MKSPSFCRAQAFWKLTASFLALGMGSCNRPTVGAPEPPAASTTEPTVLTVQTMNPERSTLRRTVTQPGYIQGYEQTPLFSKIAGYVQKLNVDIGDRVSKEMVLAELYVPEMEVDLAQKNALVSQAEAEVRQAKEMVLVAESDFHSAEAKVQAAQAIRQRAEAQLQRDQSRYERLAQAGRSGTIGKEDVEENRLTAETSRAALAEVEAQVRSAEADRNASKAKWAKSKVDVTVAAAHLEVAQQNRAQVQTMLGYRTIRAPFDGVVTQRPVDTGHFVQPATGPNSQPLFVVVRTDLLRIRVEVPEVDAAWVEQGSPATFRIPVLPSYAYSGKVMRTSWSVDRTAHTLLAEIDVSDPNGKLRAGMYVNASITVERPNVLTLPASALITEGDVNQGYRTFCFLVENGKAWRVPVEMGARDSRRVEVLKKQMRPAKDGEQGSWQAFTGTEEIVQDHIGSLTDGQPITTARSS